MAPLRHLTHFQEAQNPLVQDEAWPGTKIPGCVLLTADIHLKRLTSKHVRARKGTERRRETGGGEDDGGTAYQKFLPLKLPLLPLLVSMPFSGSREIVRPQKPPWNFESGI